jgi:CopG family transcriptional regulator/antitoxin EndoAI
MDFMARLAENSILTGFAGVLFRLYARKSTGRSAEGLRLAQYSVILSIMRTTKVISITLPPAMFEQAQALAKQENRTMSELFREALRRYERERFFERARVLMKPAADRLGIKNEEDVVELVRQVRREMAEEKRSAPLATETA